MSDDLRAQLQATLGAAFTLERELGGGGMSRVFVARDVTLGRDVVVKVLAQELAAAVSVERFTREIAMAARLQQANIVPVLASGASGGLPYYMMPFVAGESLRTAMSKVIPMADRVSVLRDVARALAYAHAEGVVHRDIKPDNILLSGGTAVVTDFGIAKAISAARTKDGTAARNDDGTLTQIGSSVGTPAYMAPEQAVGETIDHRADLYAWGIVAYELLNGAHPFAGKSGTAQFIAAHIAETPRSLSDVSADIPRAIAALVMQCLAKHPSERPESATAVLAAMNATSATRTGRSRRAPWIFVAFAAATAAAAVIWWTIRATTTTSPSVATSGAINRIAVLPLDNQTGDASQAFFADGMTREVIGVLSDVGVRVLGHRAVATYRGSTLPLTTIAAALGVDALVTGAILKASDEVQVSAELTDPRTGEALWSHTFTGPAADVVTLQHQVAAEIARVIQARLTPAQTQSLHATHKVNPKAYVQYLLGSEQANQRTPESFPKAISYLRRAIALDSAFAPSYASYAIANAYGLLYQLTPTDSGRAAVEWGATRAIALDPQLGDAYLARGVARLHIDWDFPRASEDFQRGLARQTSTLARGLYMWTRWETGECRDEGIVVMRAMIENEPTTAQWRSDISWCYWALGDTASARASLTKAITVDSTFYEAFDLFGMIESAAGNVAQSARYHEKAIRLSGGDYWVRRFSEVVLDIARHDTVSAKRVLASLAKDPRLAQRAFMTFHVGLKDSAYTLLDHAVTARDGDVLWVLQGVPYFNAIRNEPRYQALLKRVGLKAAGSP